MIIQHRLRPGYGLTAELKGLSEVNVIAKLW